MNSNRIRNILLVSMLAAPLASAPSVEASRSRGKKPAATKPRVDKDKSPARRTTMSRTKDFFRNLLGGAQVQVPVGKPPTTRISENTWTLGPLRQFVNGRSFTSARRPGGATGFRISFRRPVASADPRQATYLVARRGKQRFPLYVSGRAAIAEYSNSGLRPGDSLILEAVVQVPRGTSRAATLKAAQPLPGDTTVRFVLPE